jgi:hypothetical protein
MAKSRERILGPCGSCLVQLFNFFVKLVTEPDGILLSIYFSSGWSQTYLHLKGSKVNKFSRSDQESRYSEDGEDRASEAWGKT